MNANKDILYVAQNLSNQEGRSVKRIIMKNGMLTIDFADGHTFVSNYQLLNGEYSLNPGLLSSRFTCEIKNEYGEMIQLSESDFNGFKTGLFRSEKDKVKKIITQAPNVHLSLDEKIMRCVPLIFGAFGLAYILSEEYLGF